MNKTSERLPPVGKPVVGFVWDRLANHWLVGPAIYHGTDALGKSLWTFLDRTSETMDIRQTPYYWLDYPAALGTRERTQDTDA
jgi:hypothetical protein